MFGEVQRIAADGERGGDQTRHAEDEDDALASFIVFALGHNHKQQIYIYPDEEEYKHTGEQQVQGDVLAE